jgi:hypothetical protein
MRHHVTKLLRSRVLLLSLIASPLVGGGALAGEPVAPFPLIEQCAELRDGGKMVELAGSLQNRELAAPARMAIIEKLGRSCDRGATEQLLGLLNDGEVAVRVAAIEALGRLGDPEAIDPLIDQIGAGPDEVRLALARSLISFKLTKARSAVVNVIIHPLNRPVLGEGDMRVRGSAILTLNELPNPAFNRKSIGFLYEIKQSPDPAVVKVVEETLTLLPKTRNGAREMVGIIRNNNIPGLRAWMCEWIGRLQIVEGRESLSEIAASDPDARTRAAAQRALEQLKD